MKGIQSMQVKEVMTSELITVSENTIMSEVDKIFEQNNFRHLPVVREGGRELCGIISVMDVALLKDWGTRLNIESSLKNNEKLFTSLLACDIMKKQPVFVKPDDSLVECAELFESNAFHALPVVEQGQVVGMITTYDLIRVAYR